MLGVFILPLFNLGIIHTGRIFSDGKISEKDLISAGNSAVKAVEINYRAYTHWHCSNISPLAWEAQTAGLNASQSEIEKFNHEFSIVFPGMQAISRTVLNEALARKYVYEVIGISITEKERENAYDEIIKNYANGSAPAMSDIAYIIEARAYASLPVIQGEILRINDKNEQLKIKSKKEIENWTLEQLRLPYDNTYCIAEHPDSSNCMLTAGCFNNFLRYQEYSTSVPLDTARKMAITSMLFDKYLFDQAKRSGYDTTGDGIEGSYDWLKWSAQHERFKNLGFPVTDEHILRKIYDEFFSLLFRGRKKIWCSFIGSSDSAYIDSVYLSCLDTAGQKISNEKLQLRDTLTSNKNNWSYSSSELLPEVLSRVLDTLHYGTISQRIKTSFGFYLLRIDSIATSNSIPYEVATEKLSLIATKRKWVNFDSLIAATSFQVYASGKNSIYKVRDTLVLKMYLYAGINPDSLWWNQINVTSVKSDSSGVQAKYLKLSSVQLPEDLSDSLYKQYVKSKKQGKTFGPIVSRYGVCYFKITDIKLGKSTIPYSLVKRKITDSLIVASVDSGICALYEKPDSLLRNVSIARSYNKVFFEPLENDNSNVYKENEDYYDVKLSEVQTWIEKITIHGN
ncbi:MAG: hypothetical protein JW915_21205 [Chitinispirillaceae bacterium]|nr:hypothetical protein [Chitinispirillaceae bacterium]